MRAAASVVKYLWDLVLYFFSPLFFLPPDHIQAETLQWRCGYLSVPVRHSIRTDGSSVIKMALRYNGEDEDARESAASPLFLLSTRDDFVEWWTRSLPSDLQPFDRNSSLITAAAISIFRRSPITTRSRWWTKRSRNRTDIERTTRLLIYYVLWPSYYCFFFFFWNRRNRMNLIAIYSLFESILLAIVLFLPFLLFLLLSVFLKSIGLPA